MPRQSRPTVESLEAKALLSLPGLVTSVTTDRAVYEVGEPVRMTFTATNETDQPVSFAPDDEAMDFTVSSGGKTIWDEDYGQITLPLAVVETLAPGQSFTLTATWDGTPNEGPATTPAGPLQVQCELDRTATATIEAVFSPPATYSPIVPISPLEGGPFGGNPAYAADTQVGDLYDMILGRDADPAGQGNGVEALKAGVPLASLASVLLHSAEYDYETVAEDYAYDLGRSGSPAEIDGWVGLMQRGMTAEQVAAKFLASPEFSAMHPATSDFVQDVYGDALGRPATAAEVTAWESSGADRATIVADVLNSTEADTKAVQGLYADVLGRSADPAGLATAVPELQTGQVTLDDLAASLFGSAEFKARADQTSLL